MTDATNESPALSPTPPPAPAPVPEAVVEKADVPEKTSGWMTVLSHRATSFIIGLFFVGLGQYLFAKEDSVFLRQFFTAQLQDLFRFNLLNQENSITGALALILAAVLILRSLAPFTPPGDLVVPVEKARVNVRSFLLRKALLLLGGVILFVLLLIQMNYADPSAGLVFVLIFSVFLLLRVAYHWDRETGTSLSLGITRWDVFWLVTLLVVGLLVGSYNLDSIPNSLMRDEGLFWQRASTIAQGRGKAVFLRRGRVLLPAVKLLLSGGIFVSVWLHDLELALRVSGHRRAGGPPAVPAGEGDV
jgi:hypothetical protein